MKNYDRVCAYIDLDAILENAEAIKTNIDKNTNIIAVVKTDAYGHGVVPVSIELEKLDFIHGFAVATAEEALMLRERGVRKIIIILGYTFPYSMALRIISAVRSALEETPCILRLDINPPQNASPAPVASTAFTLRPSTRITSPRKNA